MLRAQHLNDEDMLERPGEEELDLNLMLFSSNFMTLDHLFHLSKFPHVKKQKVTSTTGTLWRLNKMSEMTQWLSIWQLFMYAISLLGY